MQQMMLAINIEKTDIIMEKINAEMSVTRLIVCVEYSGPVIGLLYENVNSILASHLTIRRSPLVRKW